MSVMSLRQQFRFSLPGGIHTQAIGDAIQIRAELPLFPVASYGAKTGAKKTSWVRSSAVLYACGVARTVAQNCRIIPLNQGISRRAVACLNGGVINCASRIRIPPVLVKCASLMITSVPHKMIRVHPKKSSVPPNFTVSLAKQKKSLAAEYSFCRKAFLSLYRGKQKKQTRTCAQRAQRSSLSNLVTRTGIEPMLTA